MEVGGGGTSGFKDFDDIFGECEPEDKPTSLADVVPWDVEPKPPSLVQEDAHSSVATPVGDAFLVTWDTSVATMEFKTSESLDFLDIPSERSGFGEAPRESFADVLAPVDSLTEFLDIASERSGFGEAPRESFADVLAPVDSLTEFLDIASERSGFGEAPRESERSSFGEAPRESFAEFSAPVDSSTEFLDIPSERSSFGEAPRESFAEFSAPVDSSTEFGDFSAPADDYADFTPSSVADASSADDFGDFESSGVTSFGDFTFVPPPPHVASTPVPFDQAKITSLLAQGFPILSSTRPSLFLPTTSSSTTPHQILGSVDFENTQKPIVCTSLLDVLVKDIHTNHVKWDASTASVREEAAYALQQCKATLAQKVNEAVVHHALFSETSTAYAEYQSTIHSSDRSAILAALRKLQLDIFEDMSTKATLSMAEQAALSAQASIASHAQQHKDKAPGLKFQFAWHSKDKPDHDDRVASIRVLTPTGASISKLHRNSFSNMHATTNTASGGGSEGEHTSGSDGDGDNWETASATSDCTTGGTADDHRPSQPSRTGSGSLAGAVTGSGLMKKLSTKLGFSSLRSTLSLASTKTKVVSLSLRRKGDSAVRTFDAPMDSISGGFDELKWKCAVFLYDADEVAAVAPSQIQVIGSNGVTVSSTDRFALQKLLKDKGTVWTIDVGTDAKESTSDT
ncbi:hypothetical protein H257_00760 [Aphanomyces astaci]|uniref:Uncharacterized protein n=1 Tax=Aphanomyces astaci TaxID=112090 RepID=W4HC39_APHAT|nr:hypothetical protein H257_00760 [Aphanomyces astaci]ETV89497.1 hypothetical protein H257_00760 [Aphanomyces astaci]|eukprot:XP_009821897.1 hypothetical protein H257_00760 [Aphanomyces astaci]